MRPGTVTIADDLVPRVLVPRFLAGELNQSCLTRKTPLTLETYRCFYFFRRSTHVRFFSHKSHRQLPTYNLKVTHVTSKRDADRQKNLRVSSIATPPTLFVWTP